MAWFRMYEGIASDAKWPVIARKAKVKVGVVVSVWVALLDHASQSDDRGSIADFDCETIDALYGYKDGTCESVIAAMTQKGLLEDDRIVKWEKRQPTREDASATKRSREYRERQKTQTAREEQQETPKNAGETPCNADETQAQRSETQCNAGETQGNAPDKIRIDKIKNLNTPPLPPASGGNADCPSQPDLPLANSPARKPRKREPTGNTAQELRAAIDAYTGNPDLRKTLEDFRTMRERMRKPLTGRGLELLFASLEKLAAKDEAMQIAILEQSIMRSWQGVFPLEDSRQTRASPVQQPKTFAQLEEDRWQAMLADAAKRDAERAKQGKTA